MRPEAELAWRLADYLAARTDPPSRLESNPSACEGELMTDDEVLEFLKDGRATIMILRDKGSEHTGRVQLAFWADLAFLLEIGRISQDDYNELTDPGLYSFQKPI